jgi:methylase of polypeptide subunit release factors
MKHVRDALQEAGFDEAAVRAAVGTSPAAEAIPLHARLAGDDDGVGLVRLFLLGEAIPAADLPLPARVLEDAGLVEREGDLVKAPFRLAPFDDLLIAHDDEEGAGAEHVGGVNNASRSLASLTVRLPVGRALDLGTGCGIQALLAAAHADEVVATDVNERALRYADLNARLNGVSVDLRRGSWFEPVAGERFGLIVANPPFVISPDNDYVFRDSGLGTDAISREVVRGAAAQLEEDGFATVLCNWICREPGETWQPLEPWVEGLGCDALLLALTPVDPFHYATRWNEPLRSNVDAYSAAIERWVAYYEREEVLAIGVGGVILRRRTGQNWTRGYDIQRGPSGAAGGQLLRMFAAVDAEVELASDEALLAQRFQLASPHRLDQSLSHQDGQYQLSGVDIVLADGVGIVGTIDPAALPALFALDPSRTLAEVAKEAELEPALVAPSVRRLFELGFVERL